jgi:hypothetical protein
MNPVKDHPSDRRSRRRMLRERVQALDRALGAERLRHEQQIEQIRFTGRYLAARPLAGVER